MKRSVPYLLLLVAYRLCLTSCGIGWYHFSTEVPLDEIIQPG